MSSLNELQKILEKYDPNGTLKGLSYHLTWNESLGFNGASDFIVGIPYNPWPQDLKDAKTEFKSSLAEALIDTVKRGLDATPKEGNIFIDIAVLDGGWFNFWNPNVVRDFCNLINALPNTVTPIVRIVVGTDADKTASDFWNSSDGEQAYVNTFWRQNQPLCTHPNAKLSIGSYSPNFVAKNLRDVSGVPQDLDFLLQIIRTIVNNIFLGSEISSTIKSKHESALNMLKTEGVIQQVLNLTQRNISWNHAKIAAVAETSGHRTETIKKKYVTFNASSKEMPHFKRMHTATTFGVTLTHHTIRTSIRIARLHSLIKKMSGLRGPMSKSRFLIGSRQNGTIPVLSVAKLGDWTGSMTKLQYPVQVVDAARDVVLNAIFRLFWTMDSGAYVRLFKDLILPAVSDQKLMASLQKAGITPTAWASRIARCEAIRVAKQAVYIDAQILGCYFQANETAFAGPDGPLDKVNNAVGLQGKAKWDGVTWPYDLVMALTTFIQNVTVKEGNGVFILLTSQAGSGGYNDEPAANEFKQRLRWFADRPFFEADSNYNKWFDARCQIRRISKDGSMYNHCKVVCCDRKLLYIGSDNPYPNYNEEQGVWVDNENAIGAWYNEFWSPRWKQSEPADMNPNAGIKSASMK